MSDEGMSDDVLREIRSWAATEDEYSMTLATLTMRTLIARLDAAWRERDALREALERLAKVTDDPFTFNGCKMQCARTARRDARAALTANHSAPVVD